LHGDTEGVALSKPRKRWKPAGESWPSMLSKDIVFYTRAINDNNLYLTVAVRYENIPIGTPVADISLKLYNPPNPNLYSEYEIPNQSDYINVTLSPVNTIYGTNILAQTYPSTMQDSPYGNYLNLKVIRVSGVYQASIRRVSSVYLYTPDRGLIQVRYRGVYMGEGGWH
jgi:hypothetical protein